MWIFIDPDSKSRLGKDLSTYVHKERGRERQKCQQAQGVIFLKCWCGKCLVDITRAATWAWSSLHEAWTYKVSMFHEYVVRIFHFLSVNFCKSNLFLNKLVCLPNFGGNSLPCDFNFLMDLRRVADFQFIQLVSWMWGQEWWLPSPLHAGSETRREDLEERKIHAGKSQFLEGSVWGGGAGGVA